MDKQLKELREAFKAYSECEAVKRMNMVNHQEWAESKALLKNIERAINRLERKAYDLASEQNVGLFGGDSS